MVLKMNSDELNTKGDRPDDMSVDQLLPLESPDACDIFGDPEVHPRIGEEYQVEIPQPMGKSWYISQLRKPMHVESKAGIPDFSIGLPIPLKWINQEFGNLKQESDGFPVESKNQQKDYGLHVVFGDTKIKLEHSDMAQDSSGSGKLNNSSTEENLKYFRCPGSSLVPGLAFSSWKDNEKDSFLLGLYIFGKNFVQLKKFLDCKSIGDIMSFYYGVFYGSLEYQRWSDCRKMKSRKCVCGQKIFSGLRLQELLNRLSSTETEESQKNLLEVSKTFAEGKMALEEYVFLLKAMVGMATLVEAVGIGKGKQDLTVMAFEPSRSNQALPIRPEIPAGKACSSLTPNEIVKFLTGDYRLSKARSNDLFWEAVWPRLLARGWHSEEPGNQGFFAGSKSSLVFLTPGIKKFSRRRLVKGDHYFDSVSDVLSKVASEPALLELDVQEGDNKKTEVDECNNDTKSEEDDSPARRRHCYLQPRTPARTGDGIKFTVVDTSLADGKPYKVRELRSLPFEFSHKLSCRSYEDSDEYATDISSGGSGGDGSSMLGHAETNAGSGILTNGEVLRDGKDSEIIGSKRKISDASKQEIGSSFPQSGSVSVNDTRKSRNASEEQQSRKATKGSLSQINLDNIAPVTKKRRRLTACSRAETSSVMANSSLVPRMEVDMSSCCSSTHDFSGASHLGVSLDKLSSTNSSRNSPAESVEFVSNNNSPTKKDHGSDLQCRTLIDLNVPQIPPDLEHDTFMTNLTQEQDDKDHKEPGRNHGTKTNTDMASAEEQQPGTNSRRHSTRNRPPTARALEALASGFLTVNRRKKSKGGSTRENLMAGNSHDSQTGTATTPQSSPNLAVPGRGGGEAATSDGTSVIRNFQLLPKQDGPPTMGP